MRFTPIEDPRPSDTAWPGMTWPIPDSTVRRGATVELSIFDAGRDADEVFRALNHDAVWKHVPGRPLSSSNIVENLTRRRESGYVTWVARLVRDLNGLGAGAVAGISSYLDVVPADARLEIGFTAYTPAVWATQVNPETKLLLLGLAFDELGAGRVQLKTDVRNHRSQQAIARLGASYEGTLRRHFRRSDGTMRDSILFSIIAEEWPAVREGLEARSVLVGPGV